MVSEDNRIYPSDLTREQFETVRPLLEAARKKTKPRKIDLFHVFNAVLYLLKTGCQWRMLPKEYPKWRTVHEYFTIWRTPQQGQEHCLLEQVLKKIVGKARCQQGRKEETSFLIVDAQSVSNTNCAEQKGYDAGKKVSGIKRHIAVDIEGLPHAIGITTANVTDRTGAIDILSSYRDSLGTVEMVLVDGGYTGQPFAQGVKELIGASVQVAKRNELNKFEVIPKRWVVERSFSWLEKCRRLWKNCERFLQSSLAMVALAFIALILRRF
nr:IS5 family transposase [Nitrosomonas sp. Nm166]